MKEKIDYKSPSNVNTVITDGMVAVRSSLKEKKSYLCIICRHILIKILKLANYRLDLFDIYVSPSINDIKRKSRGDRDRENIYNYDIQHSLLADFTELLNPSDFKTQFLRFLFKEYEDLVYGPIIGEKVLYRLMDNEYKSLIKTISFHLKRDMSCMVTILKLIPVSCSM